MKFKVEKLFRDFVKTVELLRSENGCPWDREQTMESMRGNVIEEAYEVVEAIDEGNHEKLKEELGDLLLQVVFLSQIAKEEGKFTISDVIEGINKKLIHRHPHVFGKVKVKDTNEVLRNWAEIKRKEKKGKGILDGVPKALPQLYRAKRIQEKVSRVGFDWERWEEVYEKILEELNELKNAIKSKNQEEIENEAGDLLFAVVNLARFLKVNAEDALRKTNERFIKRWKEMEEMALKEGKDITAMKIDELSELWEASKRKEKNK
jgi:tetrapyrrole methylase family protein/MazG family protein